MDVENPDGPNRCSPVCDNPGTLGSDPIRSRESTIWDVTDNRHLGGKFTQKIAELRDPCRIPTAGVDLKKYAPNPPPSGRFQIILETVQVFRSDGSRDSEPDQVVIGLQFQAGRLVFLIWVQTGHHLEVSFRHRHQDHRILVHLYLLAVPVW